MHDILGEKIEVGDQVVVTTLHYRVARLLRGTVESITAYSAARVITEDGDITTATSTQLAKV